MIYSKISIGAQRRTKELVNAIQKNKDTMLYMQHRRILNIKGTVVNLTFCK